MIDSPNLHNITPKQRECYDFIVEYMATHNGGSPSYEEVTEAMKLKSRNGAHRLIHGLKERGWINFLPHRARTISLTDKGAAERWKSNIETNIKNNPQLDTDGLAVPAKSAV